MTFNLNPVFVTFPVLQLSIFQPGNQSPKPGNCLPKPSHQSPKPTNQSLKTGNQSPKLTNQSPIAGNHSLKTVKNKEIPWCRYPQVYIHQHITNF